MQTQLYPPEFAENSLEALISDDARRSHAIYLLLIGTLLAAIVALPLVRVNVTVQSPGLIRPATGKHELKARASGVVDSVLVHDNEHVAAGQPVAVLRAATLDEQDRLLGSQTGELRGFAHDLQLLVALREGAGASGFQTARYRQAYAQFANEVREAESRRAQAARELERARALGQRDLAPASEVEQKEFALAQARAEAASVRERFLAGWQADLTQVRGQLRDLQAQAGKLKEDRSLYTITAPVEGTIEELRPVSPGSFVAQGEQLATLSPSSQLLVETYVTPRDIGLIHPGSAVRMQVDAFNYNQWGFATGRVLNISDDFVLLGQQPMFKVVCSLDQRQLSLPNGFHGRLRKGMTLRARFVVTERSVLQLLFDDVNDWLNPTQSGPSLPDAMKEAR
ncbi:MAG TPA: HlyD family efflux transporter periplasmic adaptor subunit [Longimicrobiaceae bacterium]|nr:HlyD family efflux transporter periplasmic adaptor subunit [Longimicrobiaceae bacterium]